MFSKLNPYSIVKVVKYLELRFNYIGEFLEFSSVHSMVVIIAWVNGGRSDLHA